MSRGGGSGNRRVLVRAVSHLRATRGNGHQGRGGLGLGESGSIDGSGNGGDGGDGGELHCNEGR